MIADYPRWIFASVSKHFTDMLTEPVLITAVFDDNNVAKDYFELAVEGPFFSELSKGYWKAFFIVQIRAITHQGTDAHKIHRMVGEVSENFSNISIFKFGTPGDDTLIDCASLVGLEIHHFGLVNKDLATIEASVVGQLELFFNI